MVIDAVHVAFYEKHLEVLLKVKGEWKKHEEK